MGRDGRGNHTSPSVTTKTSENSPLTLFPSVIHSSLPSFSFALPMRSSLFHQRAGSNVASAVRRGGNVEYLIELRSQRGCTTVVSLPLVKASKALLRVLFSTIIRLRISMLRYFDNKERACLKLMCTCELNASVKIRNVGCLVSYLHFTFLVAGQIAHCKKRDSVSFVQKFANVHQSDRII